MSRRCPIFLLLFAVIGALGTSSAVFAQSQADKNPSKGSIYLIGTYHDPIAVTTQREQTSRWIEARSTPLDVVLYEGEPANLAQFKPSRTIFDRTNGTALPYYTFNKDLYLIAWENAFNLKLASWADHLKSQHALSQDIVAKARVEFFYFYVVYFQRNQKLLAFLKDAISRMPAHKNVFVLIGGGHLSDPVLIDGVRSLDRSYQVVVDERALVNVHAHYINSKVQLSRLGQSTRQIEEAYAQLESTIQEKRVLLSSDLERARRVILNLAPDCDSNLEP